MKKFLLPVEAGEIYDRLSIMMVKKSKTSLKDQSLINSQIEEVQSIINSTIGYDLASQIFKSDEYQNLYSINLQLFNFFDEMNNGIEISSIIINELNYDRFLLKKELQKKFMNEEFSEIKIGYK